jgi:catechol 2,3-dioxygenase-like lactoylglutathione lyase family enzyme
MTAALPVTGVHHIKLPVADLARSRAWYEQLLGLTVELEFRDGDGTVRGVAYHPVGGLRLALREDAERAGALAGWDPIALAVESRADLDAVAVELDRRSIPHGPVTTATLGWMLAVGDPDGRPLRFYTNERHPPSNLPGAGEQPAAPLRERA